jgi:hypothetical protein
VKEKHVRVHLTHQSARKVEEPGQMGDGDITIDGSVHITTVSDPLDDLSLFILAH